VDESGSIDIDLIQLTDLVTNTAYRLLKSQSKHAKANLERLEPLLASGKIIHFNGDF